MSTYKEYVCSCDKCVSMCENRPCWGTPEEAEAIINAGLGHKLMIDYWVAEGIEQDDIHMLQPSIVGYEGEYAPYIPRGRCAFLENNLCTLHDKGLKPLEGRTADCNHGAMPIKEWNVLQTKIRKHIVAEWDTEKGKEVLNKLYTITRE